MPKVIKFPLAGLRGDVRDTHPYSVHLLSFSCSSWQKMGLNNRLAPPPLVLVEQRLGNVGSATEPRCMFWDGELPLNILR